jgi:hypothetical protein
LAGLWNQGIPRPPDGGLSSPQRHGTVARVTKRVRRSADYFAQLPKADPLSPTPRSSAEATGPTRGAVQALVPGWAREDVQEDDGQAHFPRLPKDQQWVHLTDDPEFERDELERTGPGKQAWVKTLVRDRKPEHADNPARVMEEDGVWLDRVWHDTTADDGERPLARLRKVGLMLAEEHEEARSPGFERVKAEGIHSSDYPLPGTSFALFGVRGSFGRQHVTTARVEADRLFNDQEDRRHSGKPDLKAAPLDAYKARKMKAGERYQVGTQRTILADCGLKYTPSPLPGVTSSMIHDLGPSASTELTVAVEGETSLEVVRGFGSKVAVRIDARDERVKPGEDRSWKAHLGLFVDGSLLEYGAKNFERLAEDNVERELESLEDQRRLIDQKVTPWTEKVNDRGRLVAEAGTKASASSINLVEVVFDLAKPNARRAFNGLLGASYTGTRGIDFESLKALPPESGVELVTNNATVAARRGVRRALAAFGWESEKLKVAEKSETREGPEGEGQTIKAQHHALLRRTRTPSGEKVSTTVGRVKTQTDDASDASRTGVGFGWDFRVHDREVGSDDVGQVLGFAAAACPRPEAMARLEALHQEAAERPRRKVLGLKVGKRSFGEAELRFRVEVSSDAVTRLFERLDTEAGKAELYRGMAEAYARQHGLDEVPDWPVARLEEDGVMAAVQRKLFTFSDADGAFLTARAALGALEEARAADDPVEAAQTLGRAVAFLRDEAGMAGALVAACRGPEDEPGVEVAVEVEGLKLGAVRDAPMPPEAEPKPLPQR